MIEENEDILLLDSDIFIPDEFMKFIDFPLKIDTLYSFKRYNYHSYNNFVNDVYDKRYPYNFMGFFQLYKNNKKYYYEDSENCRKCDNVFSKKFPQRILLHELVLKHLGKDEVNHYGRKNHKDFIF